MATQWTRWLMGNRSRVRMALLIGVVALALTGGMVVSLAGRPRAAMRSAATLLPMNGQGRVLG
ncbi:MAG TPA: hypothetical protein VGF38_18830 [Ktedonobacterales bacterium]